MKSVVKGGFSLIEIIFVIAVVSIILVVAVPKLNTTLNTANKGKIKSDVLLIREALNNYKNKMILKNGSATLHSLEDDPQYLFGKILSNPIKVTTNPKFGSWEKTSDGHYKVYLENGDSVEFIYDHDDFSFECDWDNLYCQELLD